MTAITPPSNDPEEESYAEFVGRKFPDQFGQIQNLPNLKADALWAFVDKDRRFPRRNESARITIVDFLTIPRIFVLRLDVSVDSWKSRVHDMTTFIRNSSSNGVLILWEYTRAWSDGVNRSQYLLIPEWTGFLLEYLIVAALAQTTFADPMNVSRLSKYWHRKAEEHTNHDGELHKEHPQEKHDDPLQMLMRVSRNIKFSDINRPSNTQYRLLPLLNEHIFNLSSCRDTTEDQIPTYLICREHLAESVLGFEDMGKWALSHSSPQACISSATSLEVEAMLKASAQIVDRVTGAEMNSHVYRASRSLRVLSKTLTRNLQHMKHAARDVLIPTNLSKMASDLEEELEMFEPYVKDAYQMFIDFEALKGTRKSIEMAEMSIEMSKKSIKESERVRILTIIAMIFLPISLASSIFGMNVTIIDSERTPFYAFVMTAVGLFIGALLIWAGSSIFVRYQKLDQASNKLRDKLKKPTPAEERKMLQIAGTRKSRFRAATISWWTQRDATEVLYEMGARQREKLIAYFRGL